MSFPDNDEKKKEKQCAKHRHVKHCKKKCKCNIRIKKIRNRQEL
jgi:hypothetical protein